MEPREIRKGSNPSNRVNETKEANIIIEGHHLTYQESMTIRVAMNNFLMTLNEEGLGDDDLGKKLTASYRLHARSVLKFIHEGTR